MSSDLKRFETRFCLEEDRFWVFIWLLVGVEVSLNRYLYIFLGLGRTCACAWAGAIIGETVQGLLHQGEAKWRLILSYDWRWWFKEIFWLNWLCFFDGHDLLRWYYLLELKVFILLLFPIIPLLHSNEMGTTLFLVDHHFFLVMEYELAKNALINCIRTIFVDLPTCSVLFDLDFMWLV